MKKFILIFILISIPAYAQIYKSNTKKWPQGIISYYFYGNITYKERQFIRDAMNDWEQGTPIKFIEVAFPRSAQERIGKVLIIKTYQNIYGTQSWGNSSVGYTERPCVEFLSSILKSNNQWTIKHELGHIIGLQHEHQRPDRDQYIWLNYKNIDKDKIGNYYKIDNSLIVEENYEYDYRSIMHYSHFSKLGKVIYEKNKQHIELKEITELDRKKVCDIYNKFYFYVGLDESYQFYITEYFNFWMFTIIFFIVWTYIVIILRDNK